MNNYSELAQKAKQLSEDADVLTTNGYIVCTTDKARQYDYLQKYRKGKGNIESYEQTPLDRELKIYRVAISYPNGEYGEPQFNFEEYTTN